MSRWTRYDLGDISMYASRRIILKWIIQNLHKMTWTEATIYNFYSSENVKYGSLVSMYDCELKNRKCVMGWIGFVITHKKRMFVEDVLLSRNVTEAITFLTYSQGALFECQSGLRLSRDILSLPVSLQMYGRMVASHDPFLPSPFKFRAWVSSHIVLR
jgi:hypothetical protein